MIKLIGKRRAEAILRRHSAEIDAICRRYGLPPALLRAVLYKELTMIDLFDPMADFIVWTGLFSKKDSSTGYAQIFGRVGLQAINFAAEHGLADYAALGFPDVARLDPDDLRDVRRVWKRLRHDRRANLELAALNLLSAAEELTGHYDFSRMGEEELKRILSRYNAATRSITPYGEDAYRHYLRYLAAETEETA